MVIDPQPSRLSPARGAKFHPPKQSLTGTLVTQGTGNSSSIAIDGRFEAFSSWYSQQHGGANAHETWPPGALEVSIWCQAPCFETFEVRNYAIITATSRGVLRFPAGIFWYAIHAVCLHHLAQLQQAFPDTSHCSPARAATTSAYLDRCSFTAAYARCYAHSQITDRCQRFHTRHCCPGEAGAGDS